MGVDRYWEAQDELQQCPAKLAAANAKIVELEREAVDLHAAAEQLHAANAERSQLLVDFLRVSTENHELRAAQTASEERVRAVVERAAADILGPNGPTCRDWSVASRAIAARATHQLAGVWLSAEERADLDALRDSLAEQRQSAITNGQFDEADTFRDWHAALDRLLARSTP